MEEEKFEEKNDEAIKVQPEQETKLNEPTEEELLAYEKASYSPFSYNQVQKLRLAGKMHKVKVPYLDHMLTKPEKTRKSFVAVGIISIIIAVAVALLAIMCTISITIPLFQTTSEIAGEGTPSYDYLGIVKGLRGAGMFLMWIFLIAMYGFFFAMIGYLIYFARESFNLSKANREEVAKGHSIFRFLFSAVLWLAIVAAVTIFMMFTLSKNSNTAAIIVMILGLVLLVGCIAIVIMIIYNIIQENKWFKTLPEDQQKNYKEHARALRHAKSRKESYDNRYRSGLFWR